MKMSASLVALALVLIPIPAAAGASLQWFGYAAVGFCDDTGLDGAKSYANVAEIAYDPAHSGGAVGARVLAISQRGMRAIIDVGQLLWQPPLYNQLVSNYQTVWQSWVQANSAALTSDKVLAIGLLDEPFGRSANMAQYEAAAQMIKQTFPWVRLYLIEGATTVLQTGGTFDGYHANPPTIAGTLPGIDWLGVDIYNIDPVTDPTFKGALAKLKGRFPGRGTVYVMDAYYHGGDINVMGAVADEWYQVANADTSAVMMVPFLWGEGPYVPNAPPTQPCVSSTINARDFPCSVLSHHIQIGRAITGRARTRNSLPIGYLDGIDSHGCAAGWACDPDAAYCENVNVYFYADGSYQTYAYAGNASESAVNSLCGNGPAHRFLQCLPASTAGHQITVYSPDLDYGTLSPIPSYSCAARPACVWYPNAYPPKGFLDGISATGYAIGWACDPDAPNVSIQVLFQAAGSSAGTYQANVPSEPAVNNLCGGGSAHRFGVQLPAWTKGLSVAAYGLDTMSGQAILPGWLCPQNPYCRW